MENIPEIDLNRSSIAKHIGKLAEINGLFLSHYEYRQQFDVPDLWKNASRNDLAFESAWENGSLKEFKYQSFRNDIRIGSFHPGHQNKWTTHELCHGLVGFAWNEEWEFFDHAIAARLSELLPVVVYYFYDEADTQRCEKHAFPNIFYGYCAACELKSELGPKINDEQKSYWMTKGKRFFENEMKAIKESIDKRECIYHVDHNLNLMSDGLAYVSQQYDRITSPEYKDFIKRFYTKRDYFDTIDNLIEHVEKVHEDLIYERIVDYRFGDSNRHKIKDVVWRFYELSVDCSDDLKKDVLALIDECATNMSNSAYDFAQELYKQVANEWELPELVDVYAFGYTLPKNVGYSTNIIVEGINKSFEDNIDLIEAETIKTFMEIDRKDRAILPRRFVRYLQDTNHDYSKLFHFLSALHFPEQADELIVSFKSQTAHLYKKLKHEFYKFNSVELQELGFEITKESESLILFPYRESVDEMSIVEIPQVLDVWFRKLPDEFLYSDYSQDVEFIQSAINLGIIKGLKW